jgi:hypothetical protein
MVPEGPEMVTGTRIVVDKIGSNPCIASLSPGDDIKFYIFTVP